MNLPYRLVALLALLTATGLAACKGAKKSKDQASQPRSITVVFKRDYKGHSVSDFEVAGARVFVGGVDEGILEDREDGPRVGVDLDERSFENENVEVMLKFPTPCGGKSVEVRYVYRVVDNPMKPQRGYPEVHLQRTEATNLPTGRSVVYVDEGATSGKKVTFGDIEIAGRVRDKEKQRADSGKLMTLWDVGCATKHAVKIDGIEIGVALVDPVAVEKDKAGYLVSVDPDVCYRREIAHYADAHDAMGGPGGNAVDLPAGRVVPTGWGRFDHFLERTPSGAPVGTRMRTAIYRVRCDEDHEKARRALTKPVAPKGSAPPRHHGRLN
jgi:hypothetical protein